MRTVSDAVETERAMCHEAQEARRTAEIELQEVSAELNLLLEAASDGTDIGHDPCPRCGCQGRETAGRKAPSWG